jgi:diguanylate cyclase (GGDEF)-like protein
MDNRFFKIFNKLPTRIRDFVVYILLGLTVLLDHLLGPFLSSTIFYLIPITLMAINGTLMRSMIISFIAALLSLAPDIYSGQIYDSNWIYLWNFTVRIAIFMLISKMIHSSISQSKFYRALANKDDLTGILNRRGFLEKAQEELNRAKRFKRPFSLAFIDLDNFKEVNDKFGHKAGDELLKMVAGEIRESIRMTDQVGRMGGDEFAVLFVESDQDSAVAAFQKCHTLLSEKIALQEWPVSLSAGVITYTNSNLSLTQLIEKADEWMYHVKQSGKNNVVYKYDTELLNQK